ncbi:MULTISPECIES: hypothetical protein [Polyangium]|uniref:Uncharacterized protein n=2 Tax=Polyangium TaxID=55 RepID=A0A4U1JGX2_9BACT|nr:MULTISPECIES: hypothetical protein [Polyangium]MDI1428605.1 hypothetical protein [Polyangium sorediatum]TKD11814.1 hypothetical protein E8A74_06695 [Polyangium fumosum]
MASSSSKGKLAEGEVFRSSQFVLMREAGGKLVRIRRTDVPLDDGAMSDVLAFFDRFFPPLMRTQFVLLFDSRDAPMVIDRDMERRIHEAGARLLSGFARAAVLVASATGKLQAARMTREKSRAPVFVNETEALAYLLSELSFD